MDDAYYEKTIECPICETKFEVTKVKMKACKVLSRDTDHFIVYEDVNPMFYDVWVCENCGYAALNTKFLEISDSKIVRLSKEYSPKWFKHKFSKERSFEKDIENCIDKNCLVLKNVFCRQWAKKSFSGIRSADIALESFKLCYYNLNFLKATFIEMAQISIRIAWLYRIKKDPREKIFLQNTLRIYRDIYEKSSSSSGNKMEECIYMYMMGELSVRVGDYKDGILWFGKLIREPLSKDNPKLLDSAREQMQFAREKLAEKDKEATVWSF